MIADPTPETPFLRSDCDGSCAGVGFDAITGSYGNHGHSHSHARHRLPAAPVVEAAASMSVRRSLRLQNDVPPDSGRTTPSRYSVTLSPDHMSSIDVNKIRRAVDLDDPTRTDYTYSHSDSYVRPGSSMARPQWELPKLSRVGRGRRERYAAADYSDCSDYGSDRSFGQQGCCSKALSWMASFFRSSSCIDQSLSNGPAGSGSLRVFAIKPSDGGLSSRVYSFAYTTVSIVTTIISVVTVYPAQKALGALDRSSRRRGGAWCCCLLVPLLLLASALLALAIYGAEETDRLAQMAAGNVVAGSHSVGAAVKDGAGALATSIAGAGVWLAGCWPFFYPPSTSTSLPPPPPAKGAQVDLGPLYRMVANLEARLEALEAVDRSQYLTKSHLDNAAYASSSDVVGLESRLSALAATLAALQQKDVRPDQDSMEVSGVVDMELADIKESLAALRAEVTSANGRLDSLAEDQMEQQTSSAALYARLSSDFDAKLATLASLSGRMEEVEASLAAVAGSAADQEKLREELAAVKALQQAELAALAADIRRLGADVADNGAAIQTAKTSAASLQAAVDQLSSSTAGGGTVRGGGSLTAGQVNELIAAALALYDADKTGRPDFALESAGGSVVSTRCSESYSQNTRRETIFGWFPLWYINYSPRVVIQRRTNALAPGECWAFKGPKGHLVVELSGEILVDSVSYEHISADVAPDGNIESAPKKFKMKALEDEKDAGVEIGQFEYNRYGKPLQTFQIHPARKTHYIEMVVESNHGHPNYTCLYRLRVHGKRLDGGYGTKRTRD